MKQGDKEILRTADLDFSDIYGGAYKGYKATVRLNLRYATKFDLGSGFRDRFEEALNQMILKWNFTDDDGNLIPLGQYTEVDDDLINALIEKWSAACKESAQLPKA